MTPGQQEAIEQLREIEKASNGLIEIIEIRNPFEEGGVCWIDLSFYCGNKEKSVDGLPLRSRERFMVGVFPGFPFEVPIVETSHTRFAGFPHVQWKTRLCLYQSVGTEWNSSDGMFGFVERLDYWLNKGAKNELDPTGGPLHPPVAYLCDGPIRTVVVKANTPEVIENNWFGIAHLRKVSHNRVDIYEWSEVLPEVAPGVSATAILLSEPMPFEFPATVRNLFAELLQRGLSREYLIILLQCALFQNEENSPLFVIIGAPMRGIRGGQLKQHLTAWYIPPPCVKALKLAIKKYSEDKELKDIGEDCLKIFWDWAEQANVEWCWVREDRPEIVVQRDQSTPTNWYREKTISIWGCGALGSHVAEILTRAGVRKLILRDNKTVGPGVLSRQLYFDSDIGLMKARILKERLQRIRPEIEVESYFDNILISPLDGHWTDGADLIIDTTASRSALSKLELVRKSGRIRRVPVVSMVIGHKAENCLAVVAGKDYSGGPFDIVRKAKLEACTQKGLATYLEEFWPTQEMLQERIFQPEPGCSETTFIGSEADLQALSGTMINWAGTTLTHIDDQTSACFFFTQPHTSKGETKGSHTVIWPEPDKIIRPNKEQEGFEIRLSESAWKEMQFWIEKSSREVGMEVETGGLLFGQRDDSAKIYWISEVIGPPPDSIATEAEFVCGVKGTKKVNVAKSKKSQGSIEYIGMWHTHPMGREYYSSKDLMAMRLLVTGNTSSPQYTLLVIVGTPESNPKIGGYVFHQRKLVEKDKRGKQELNLAKLLNYWWG